MGAAAALAAQGREPTVEAVHALLKRIVRTCTYMKPPAVAAEVRWPQHLRLLETSVDFRAFCVKHWRSPKLLDNLGLLA